MRIYVREQSVLDKLCLRDGEYAFWNTEDREVVKKWLNHFYRYWHGKRQDALFHSKVKKSSVKKTFSDSVDGVKGLDNFDGVESFIDDGVTFEEVGLEEFGHITVCRKHGEYEEVLYYADKYARMKCYSKRNYAYYKEIKPQGILFPQCMEVNCTMHPEYGGIRKVQIYPSSDFGKRFYNYEKATYLRDWMSLNEKLCDWNKDEYFHCERPEPLSNHYDEKREEYKDYLNLQHISFDKWLIMGAVLAYIYRIKMNIYHYNQKNKLSSKNEKKMPSVLMLRFRDIFHTICPDRDWVYVSPKQKEEFVKHCVDTFGFFNMFSMDVKKPLGKSFITKTYDKIFKTSLVQRYDEREHVWKDDGIKFLLSDCHIWKSIDYRRRWVHIHDYMLNTKDICFRLNYEKVFENAYIKYHVSMNNYNFEKQTKMRFHSGKLELTRKHFKTAFATGKFYKAKFTISDMEKMIRSMTIEKLGKYGDKNIKTRIKPAKVNEFKRITNNKISWTMIDSLRNEDAVAVGDDGKKHRIDVEKVVVSDEILNSIKDTEFINLENRKHNIVLKGLRVNSHLQTIFHQGTKYSDKENRLMKIIFGDSYGRSYTLRNGFQSLKSQERLLMTIDGEKVAEVDYSGLHINMLYSKVGKQCKGDVYDVGNGFRTKYGLDKDTCRLAAKIMLLVMINAKDFNKGIYAFRTKFNETLKEQLIEQGKLDEANKITKNTKISWAKHLYNILSIKHKDISHYFATGIGVHLQYEDGILIRRVCKKLALNGICALPVHDSIVVTRKNYQLLRYFMDTEYKKMFNGFECKTKVKMLG